MPRGRAGAWHVTRGPIPRGPNENWAIELPITLDRRAVSLGDIAEVSALRRNGGQDGPRGTVPFSRRPRCQDAEHHTCRENWDSPLTRRAAGNRELPNSSPAVAGIRAYLPAALVVERISIRRLKRRTDRKSVLPAAALLGERHYTTPAGPIPRRVSGDRRANNFGRAAIGRMAT